jgi:NADH-quinone oxidoreductase subunit G
LVAERLGKIAKHQGGAQLGALASPTATVEELYLLARLARGLGSNNIDHRLRRSDFRDEASDPLYPSLGCAIAELERANSVLVVGANLRKEVPLLAHRIRKAAIAGAAVSFVNPERYEYLFPVSAYCSPDGVDLLGHLVAIAAAAQANGASAPASIASLTASAQPNDTHRTVAQQLATGERRLILLGAIAQRHPGFADLRLVAQALAQMTGATLGYLPEGGNAVGAYLAGVLPHRAAAGRAVTTAGLNAADMLAARLKAYVLLGAIEPTVDIASATAVDALRAAEFVVALSPFGSAREFAHVILPIGTFAETSGTYVNVEGRWQSVPGAARPVGEARPAWKVLRVLGNLLGLQGFEYNSSDEITAELRKVIAEAPAFEPKSSSHAPQSNLALTSKPANLDVGIYQVDAYVRRSNALQNTREALERGRAAS